MRPAMTRKTHWPELLDPELWDTPDHLTEDDFYRAAGRPLTAFRDDGEDDR